MIDYGIIYFKNGTTKETGTFNGAGAEQSAERETAIRFDQEMKIWEKSGLPNFSNPLDIM